MVRVALALQILALAAFGAVHLAVTDIWHGESDLRLEWRVLQLAGAVILAGLLVSIATLGRLRARGGSPRNG